MTRSLPRALLLSLVLVGSAAVTIAAADVEQELDPVGGLAFVDKIEVTVVNVVAFVTDKKGNAVTDLTKDDFVILHDGEERPISNFQLYTEDVIRSRLIASAAPGGKPQLPGEDAPLPEDIQPVYLMIYIDNENVRPLDRNRVLNQTRAFIRENAKPPVQMMVVSYNRSLKVMQPFTSESRDIYEALREVRMMTGGRSNRDADRAKILEEMERQRQDQGTTEGNYHRARSMTFGFVEEEVNDLMFTMDSLREAVNMMSGLPGKKMLLYVSNGLPMMPGIDLFYSLANTFDQPSLITESTRYNQSRVFDSLVKNANAQGVTFYAIGAGGLESATMGSAQYHAPRDTLASTVGHDNYLDSLRYITEGTGGTAILNTNDVTAGLDKIEQDFYTYYSLGYNLQMSGSDKVHNVRLKLPNHPEYNMRYRRRYVEKSLESRVRDKVLTSLMIPLDDNPLEIDVGTGNHIPAGSERWMVPFNLSFPLRNVALLPEGNDYVGRIVMFVAARDNRGKQSDLVRQEHEVRVAAGDYDGAKNRRFTIKANLLMEAGRYQVAVALLDQVTRQASFQTISAAVTE